MIKIFPLIFILLWSSAFITTKPIIDNSDPFSALAFRFALVAIGFFCRKLGVNPTDELNNTIEDYLPLVKAIIQMENGMQPYDDELIVEGMYKAWEGLPTISSAS